MTADGLAGVQAWPGGPRAAGWRRLDGTRAVTDGADRSFELASVTKLLTATAVLVAVQEGVLALDEPAGPPGATVRLLLCHASGLVDDDTPLAAPGTRRMYGNAAYELLGRLVTERSGMAFGEYLHDGVLAPLEMAGTRVEGSPAHSGRSTVADLLRFAGELLAPGRVLDPAIVAEATRAQLPDLAGVLPGFGPQSPNPWGLGFELKGTKSPHWTPPEASPATFGHFGRSGSFLWVDPAAALAATALSDEPFGAWALTAWPALGSAIWEVAVG